MSASTPTRFSDAKVSQHDFVVRRKFPPLWQMMLLFLLSFAVIYVVAIFRQELGGEITLLAAIALIIGAMAWYTVSYTQRNRDMMLATEFQNALFASAAGLSTEFCFIVKRDGTIVYFDPGFQKIFPRFLIAEHRTLEGLFASEGIDPSKAKVLVDAIDEKASERIIVPLRLPDNSTIDAIISVDTLPRPKGFFLIRGRQYIEKRTGEKKSAPPAPEEREEGISPKMLSTLMDAIPFGILGIGKDGSVQFINSPLEELLGYRAQELQSGQFTFRKLIHSLDGQVPEQVKLDDFTGEAVFLKRNGNLIKLNVHSEQIKDAQGNITGYSLIVNDQPVQNAPVPAQQSRKTELTVDTAGDALVFLKEFIENSPISMVQIDSAGNVAGSNLSFQKLADRAAFHGTGWPFLNFIHESNRAEVSALAEKLLRSESDTEQLPIDVKLENDRASVVTLYLNRMAGLTPGDNHLVAHMIDMTEQKNLEMRFAHSQKMQAVGQLAGGVAHDFNNLLTAMIGFCDLLLMRHPAGDQSFADIMQVKQNANRAANLVRQLLAFSRRQTLQAKMIDITDVLAELSNLVRRLIGENIELKVVHGRDLWPIKADQGQLEQVLINLAVNARDAMPTGGTLTIQTSNVSVNRSSPIPRDLVPPTEEDKITDGDYALIEVIDNGTGIKREILQKIFEPFFSTKEVGSGTGLGLATVYGIIKQTGGYVYVSSTPGKGSRFALYFPRMAQVEATAAKEAEAQERAAPADLTGKGTILLVEDETPVRVFAARALRNKGYTVLEADCGEAGLEVMRQNGKDVEVIISDVIMPGMNGPTMVEKIVADHPHIKVIFISGYAEDAFVHTYGADRTFNFLPKPFTLKQLASKVKEVSQGPNA